MLIYLFTTDVLSKLVINTDTGAAGDNLTPNGNVPNLNGTASNGSLPSSPQLRTPTFLVIY